MSDENRSRHNISADDILVMQSIGKKSVNEFTNDELKKTQRFAERYYEELGRKSPFYRAEHGDWRENDTTPVHIVTERGSKRGITKNNDTGWDIQVSGKVFNETKAHSSGSVKRAIPYMEYINSIARNAILLDSYTIPMSKAKSSNSAMMHNFYALADAGDGVKLLKLYVEEINDVSKDGTIKRAYQLQNIIKAPAASVRVQGESLSSLTNTANADTYTVADLFRFVKQNDKNFNPKPAETNNERRSVKGVGNMADLIERYGRIPGRRNKTRN